MKNATPLILLGLAAAGAFFLSRAKNMAKTATFGFASIKLQGSQLLVGVAVNNPSSISLQFNSFVGQIFVKGSPVANITSFTPTVIKGNSETVVTLIFKLSVIGVAQFAVQALSKNGLKNLKAVLKGTANINNTSIPVAINLYE